MTPLDELKDNVEYTDRIGIGTEFIQSRILLRLKKPAYRGLFCKIDVQSSNNHHCCHLQNNHQRKSHRFHPMDLNHHLAIVQLL